MSTYNIDGAQLLFSINNMVEILNRPIYHFVKIGRNGPPAAVYNVSREGGRVQPYWDLKGVEAWREAFKMMDDESAQPVPRAMIQPSTFSDHKAVNVIGNIEVTWRLWWKPASGSDDSVIWWFSTPFGWYQSANNGVNWVRTNQMIRPAGRYFPAAPGVTTGSVAAARRGAYHLQKRLEKQREVAS